MALWIDPPQFPGHGQLWSHLVSDLSYAEVHDFAAQLGIPRRAFEGDHYDIPASRYADVVAAGAQPVSSRELLAKLQASGLRMVKRHGDRGLARVDGFVFPDGAVGTIELFLTRAEVDDSRVFAATSIVLDAEGRVLVVWSPRRREWSPPGGWREGDESPRETAAREIFEESGLRVDPAALALVGYERFSGDPGIREAERDLLPCFLVRLDLTRPPLTLEADDRPALWLDFPELRRRCHDAFWWPLVEQLLTPTD